MDNSTIESVREIFGTPFLKYCLDHKIILTKNKHGAFMVPNRNVLTECLDHLDRLKLRLNNQLKVIQGFQPTYFNHGDRSYEQYKCKTNKEQKFHKKTTYTCSNLSLTNLPLEIFLRDTSPILPSYTSYLIRTKCILDIAKSGNEIYDYIINGTMKDISITDYEASIPSVSLLLEQFQKQHKKFHYSSVLKHLTYKQEIDQNSKCKYAISVKQMKQFFDLVLAKVIPLSIFGKLKNIKKIKKALFHLLNLPRFKSLNLMLYINKLDIFSIKWLQNIKDIKVAWLVIAKFVKWFFNGFLIKILRIYFHVTTVSFSNNERIYIVRSDWCKIHKRFIEQKKRSNALQPDVQCKKEWNPPIGIYKLNPKYSTVRPILVSQHTKNANNNEEKHLYTLYKFLKQLYTTEYGLSSFEDKWRSIVQHKRILNNEKLHLISCDVMDAFGSIVQGQLYDIIQSLCDKLPEDLILRYYVVKGKRVKKDNVTCYKQYICDSHLQLPLPPGTLYVRTDYIERVRKNWLLERIRKYIFYQRVKIREKYYVIGKGIAQGTMLACVLSDIYFDSILHREMTVFLKSGKIIKYVDDILFATENEDSAKRFLQLTARGIPRYNCRFKKLKIQTNMAYDENTVADHIIYIGYKINCNTLELEPNILNTNLHYLILPSSKKDSDPLELLKLKLLNLSSLRLSKIVLDNRVNSKNTIRTILRKVCLLYAKRARILIKVLFDNMKKYARQIMKIIRSSNKKIARYIITVFLKYEEKMEKSHICRWNKEILYILWTSYKIVFMKDKILQPNFIKFFKKIFKVYLGDLLWKRTALFNVPKLLSFTSKIIAQLY